MVLMSPGSVPGGGSTTLYVLMSGPVAPGTTLNVTCNSTRLLIGTTLSCVAGEVIQTFTLATTPGLPTSVTVKISYNGSSESDTLRITT